MKNIFRLSKLYKFSFLTVFFLILFYPLIFMSKENISKQENRTLEKLPSFVDTQGFNTKFGQQFENYFLDHFGGREKFILLYYRLLRQITHKTENKYAFMTESGWIFDKFQIKTFSSGISDNTIKSIKQTLLELNIWSNLHQIKTYLLIVPEKENLLLPDSYYTPPSPDKVNILLSQLSDSPITILYPKKLYEMKYADYTFFHTDHHWSEFGAFLAYEALMEIMKKDFPKIHICTEDEFDTFYNTQARKGSFNKIFDRPYYQGSGCPKIGLKENECPLTHPYKYYNHKDKPSLLVKKGTLRQSILTHFSKVHNDYRVTVLGYSDAGFLMSFLPFSFRDVNMLRINNNEQENKLSMERFEKSILDFKSDALVIAVRASLVNELTDLFYSDKIMEKK